jgi:excinuclease ABC subunit B
MKRAIEETNRRRRLQADFNKEHGITPQTVMKSVGAPLIRIYEADYVEIPIAAERVPQFGLAEIARQLKQLKKQMKQAAEKLEFEKAAELRDRLRELEAQELALRDPGIPEGQTA